MFYYDPLCVLHWKIFAQHMRVTCLYLFEQSVLDASALPYLLLLRLNTALRLFPCMFLFRFDALPWLKMLPIRIQPRSHQPSRPRIQTFDPGLCSRTRVSFCLGLLIQTPCFLWSAHVGSCLIPSVMAGLWRLSSSSVGTFWTPLRYLVLEPICLSGSRPRSTPFRTCSRPFQIFSTRVPWNRAGWGKVLVASATSLDSC